MIYTIGKKNDRDLFRLIGKAALDPETHKKLGYHVTTKNGDIWAVTNDGNNFIVASQLASHFLKIRLALFETETAFSAMLEEIIKYAIDKRFIGIKANDRKDNALLYKRYGFEIETLIGKNFANYKKEFSSAK
ncbi:MAG: Hypothetical protein BHV28_05220 [Candidatus Tokpelaia hoelldobleri]|uniref:Uncharacterized protein n=1 Tax=Candidatus Tokpelaia hoelldobleri TaxID=1902579 RepID=A0A1U9JTN3_9HYPH|nr:MAG: Hypothetical protein BHV28_05220 [Candidatus Tokpelaia hoelldoblerii]